MLRLANVKGTTYIIERQRLWALRKNLGLVGSEPPRGDKLYTAILDDNLFCRLSDRTKAQIMAGDGNELRSTYNNPCKMQALHSSATIAVNVFEYWQQTKDGAATIARALGLPALHAEQIDFESKWTIFNQSKRKKPNIDVVIKNAPGCPEQVFAIECKFSEAYSSRKHSFLSRDYLGECGELDSSTWSGINELRELAGALRGSRPLFSPLPCPINQALSWAEA
jgi:hypothetical protein